jgi:hypothetical protein
MMLVVISAGVFGYKWSFLQATRSYGWAKTPCVVESAQLVGKGQRSGRSAKETSYFEASYRYEYQGQTYTSTRVKFSDDGAPRGGSPFKDDVWWARMYKTGAHADCYVDPRDPSEATLVPGLTFVMWGLIIWCVVWTVVDLLAWHYVRKWRREAVDAATGMQGRRAPH